MTSLQADHLRTAYGPVIVNRDVSLTVEENEIVTILGPNGAGKSTLLRAISGLLRPKTGSIRFNGKEVTGLPADRMAAQYCDVYRRLLARAKKPAFAGAEDCASLPVSAGLLTNRAVARREVVRTNSIEER